MRSVRYKRLLASILSFALVFSALAFTPNQGAVRAVAESSDKLQQRYDNLQTQQKDIQEKLAAASQERTNAQEQFNLIQEQVTNIQSQIDVLSQQITNLNQTIEGYDKQIGKLDGNIREKQAEIDKNYDLFKQRLRAMYMAGEASEIEILLSSSSFVEFTNRKEMLKGVADHDAHLIQGIVDDVKSINVSKEMLGTTKTKKENDKSKLEEYKSEIQKKREELEPSLKASEAYLKQTEEDYQSYSDRLRETVGTMDSVQALISDQRSKYTNASGGSSKGGSSGGTSNSGSTTTAPAQPYSGGKLQWPLPGFSTISSGYGSRWGSFHKGIDITGGGVYGHDIVAAESGTVIVSRDLGGADYGKYIIIDHGGGICTLYAHASALLVSEGQTVSRGQVIARVGSTGNSTGPHLHFEVRVNGSHTNPMNYL